MIQVVCGVILDGGGRYLVCRRPLSKHLGGLWEFPGGKVEPGECGRDALRRELREELGIDVEVGREFPETVRWSDGNVEISLTAYWCEITDGTPTNLEHEELRWMTGVEMRELEWAEADLPFVDIIGGLGRDQTGA